MLKYFFSGVMLLIYSLTVTAASEMLEFDSLKQEQRYLNLIDQLRCMVCQNQNLADSNAALAEDLRQLTYEKVRGGQSDGEIVDYMVTRYGDFVLYRPPFKTATYLLWFGPLVFLLLAAVTIFVFWRRSRRQSKYEFNSTERQRVQRLLDEQ